MKKQFLRLTRLILLMAMGGWFLSSAIQPTPAIAQDGDLESILARAVVKGYFISLKGGDTGSTILENFYLTEAAAASPTAQSLNELGVAAYEITNERRLDNGSFQITATIKPDNYTLTADVSKITNRWQIVDLAWIDGPDMSMMDSQPAPETVDAAEPDLAVDEAATDEAATDEAATDEAATDEATTAEAASDGEADTPVTDTEAAGEEATTDDATADEAATDDTAPTTEANPETAETTDAEAATDEAIPDTPADEATADEAATETAETPVAEDNAETTEATDTAETPPAQTESSATSGEAPTAQIASVALNVRAGPGFEHGVVTALKQGDIVGISGTNVVDGRPWYLISQNGQIIGWISAKSQYVVTLGDAASIPTVPVTTALNEIAAAEIIEVPTDTTPETTTSEPPVTSSSAIAEVTSVALNVRSGPGFEYGKVATLAQGDRVDIVGTNVNDGRPWYQIIRNGSVLGWISGKVPYVNTIGDPNTIPTLPAPPVPETTPAPETTTAAPETSSTTAKTTNSPVPVVTGNTRGGEKLIVQNRSGGDIYLVNVARTSLTFLTTGIDPALSPDGSKLAFTRWGSGGDGSVWIYDFNTGTETMIMDATQQAKSATWSPDGSHLAVSFQEGGRVNAEEKCHDLGDRKIPRNAFDINIGSESRRVCYKLPPDTHWKIRNINVVDRTYQDMASDLYSYGPTWDPSEPWRVVFAGDLGLKQLDVNRNVVLPLTDDPRDQAPVFAPDGSKIAVTYDQHQHWEIYTIDIPEGTRNRLIRISILEDTYNSAAPAFSPDGSQIAFVTDRTGQWEYWVMNADGSNPRPLLQPSAAEQIDLEYFGVDERLISWGG